MVKFIESELVLLKKEIDEMWTLVYNQLDRAGEAVLTLDKELAQQVMVRERRVNAFELKIDSDVEDIIALYNPVAIDLRFVLATWHFCIPHFWLSLHFHYLPGSIPLSCDSYNQYL